jgi:hypothetical protein
MRLNGGLRSTNLKVSAILLVKDVTAMTEYAPQAITNMFNDIKAGISAALMGGIIGDKAHTYGYHRGRNYVGGNDYSVQLAADKKGNGEAACALDISWSTAQPQYDVSKRLLNAKHDARLTKVLREFYGSTDGRTVCGWDYQGGYAVSSDDSHLWHIHISILRQYADDYNSLAPVADVIIGKSTSGGGGGGNGQEDDVPKRFQAKRIEALRVNQINTPWDMKWDQQDWDTGNIFYGTNEPTGDQKGSTIKTGGSNGASYVSTFSCVVQGMPVGQTFLVRIGFVDIASGDQTGVTSWQEFQSSGGNLEIVDTRVGYSNANRGIKITLYSGVAVDVVNAIWSVIHWPN